MMDSYCRPGILLLLLLLLLTVIELSFSGSSPYTSTYKTNKNKYTLTKQYKKHSTNNTKHRVRQKYLTIWQHSCEWNRWRGEFVPGRPSSETQSISVTMERWSVQHQVFAVGTYFKNTDSVLMTQWIFRRHFNIHRNSSVPSRNTVLLWVRNFRETAFAAKRKCPGREPSLRTLENIKCVHRAFVRSPR